MCYNGIINEKGGTIHEKTWTLILIASFLTLALCACAVPEDKVLNSLGKYKSHEFYTEGAVQDYTDYAKYYYDSVEFADNEYFTKIEQYDVDVLHEHLDDFDRQIKAIRETDATCALLFRFIGWRVI